MIPPHDTVAVMFSREQVRQRKLAHFLKTYGPGALPEGPALAAMMGTFQFFVDGWNHVPDEIYTIPEIRSFYRHLHEAWPYWFFFCDLRTETLQVPSKFPQKPENPRASTLWRRLFERICPLPSVLACQ